MRGWESVGIIIVSLCLVLVVFCGSVLWVTQSDAFYEKHAERAGVFENVPRDVALADAMQIRSFVLGENRELSFLTERERVHLEDVRLLLEYAKFLFLLGLLLSIVFVVLMVILRRVLVLVWLLRTAGVLLVTFFGVVGFVGAVGFESMFVAFHEVSFANDFWLLDPSVHELIVLFPQEFFVAAFMWIVGIGIISGGVSIAISFLLEHLKKKKLLGSSP